MLALAAGVLVAGLVGVVVVPGTPAHVAGVAPTAAPLPNHEVCPAGGLTWAVSAFSAKLDVLNPHDATVTESGTVRNDTHAYVTIDSLESTPDVTPVPGAAPPYPVYLQLVNNDLYPGESALWQGSSPEVGVSSIRKGPLQYQASWDNPSYGHCAGPAHLGAP